MVTHILIASLVGQLTIKDLPEGCWAISYPGLHNGILWYIFGPIEVAFAL